MASRFFQPQGKSRALEVAKFATDLQTQRQDQELAKRDTRVRERTADALAQTTRLQVGDPTATDPARRRGTSLGAQDISGRTVGIAEQAAALNRDKFEAQERIDRGFANSPIPDDLYMEKRAFIATGFKNLNLSKSGTMVLNTLDIAKSGGATPINMKRLASSLIDPQSRTGKALVEDINSQMERAVNSNDTVKMNELKNFSSMIGDPNFLDALFPRATGAERQIERERQEKLTAGGATPTDIDDFVARANKEAFLTTGKLLSPGKQNEAALQFKRAQAPETALTSQARVAGTKISEVNTKQYEAATAAVGQIEDIDRLITQIESSEAITGMGAEILKNIERAKTFFGSKAAEGKVKDTELLDVMMGSEVFPMIKALGVGARGMDTPAEREFMRKVLTGEISLNKGTLSEMAKIRRKVGERAIKRWNRRVDRGELDNYFKSTGLTKERIGARTENIVLKFDAQGNQIQ